MRRNRPCLVGSLAQRGALVLLLALVSSALSASGPPPSALDFFTVPPCRVFDSRPGPPIAAGSTFSSQNGGNGIAVAGVCGVPSDAVAVAFNVTILGANDDGELWVFPFGAPAPTTGSPNSIP